jgi:hypothetical protein
MLSKGTIRLGQCVARYTYIKLKIINCTSKSSWIKHDNDDRKTGHGTKTYRYLHMCFLFEDISYMCARLQQSNAQWTMAQKFTAEAAEQSRLVMTRTAKAVKYKQSSAEASRAASIARGRQNELEVVPLHPHCVCA